jgi:hypothetical protein
LITSRCAPLDEAACTDADAMKKQVSVHQLRFGVYVHELDRPWTDTPFMFQGFVLNTEPQLQALKQYCKTVLIDTDKGMDVQDRVDPFAGKMRPPSVLDDIKEKVVWEVKARSRRRCR